ncbi:DNA-binding transcriptional LysR family regulator [Herbihabitans rhizosphaerae]|uniref:DNA-binding transcriptional LysR family regulator n=1 Tax=Herbihabitans rhizosphaerae TaxID=1872711 RepID=A0A4Q7L2Z0_9PSEU|nr:LysR family transcriptional regulator [Herbihabitans rhizosphaerae]RZS43080.1 DNA-binding transcriptional LysR family regulator [Herbihabitans rhizosphaerae]
MELELRHFKIVCAVADTGSITKAAARLGLAQPALTAQLRRIERALGGPLFERDHRGTRPTPLGDLVLDRARMLLPAVSELKEEAVRLANQASASGALPARLQLGSTNGPARGGLMHHLAVDYPTIRVTMRTSWSSDDLAVKVADGTLDFIVIGVCGNGAPPAQSGVSWRTMSLDPVFVLMAEHHRLADRAEVDLADLAAEQWAATPGDGCFAGCFAAACAKAGFAPRTLYEVDVASCVDLASDGDAVVLCQPTFRMPAGVVTVPLAGQPLTWLQVIGWRRDSPASEFAERLLEIAGKGYTDAIERTPHYGAWLDRHPAFGLVRS